MLYVSVKPTENLWYVVSILSNCNIGAVLCKTLITGVPLIELSANNLKPSFVSLLKWIPFPEVLSICISAILVEDNNNLPVISVSPFTNNFLV